MNLKPLGDRVILKQDEAEVTTASGLFLASDAKEKPQTGTIIAVGEGKMDKDGKLLPMPVKVGDKVIYGKFGGTEVTLDGENVLILRADDADALRAALLACPGRPAADAPADLRPIIDEFGTFPVARPLRTANPAIPPPTRPPPFASS